ncbi:peptidase S8 [Streptomyces sp. NRRL B-1568]|nr:peptidase S8 [Streptomyces sp. NRRL B-1568]
MKRLARYATAALIFLAPLAPMAPLAAATASSAEPDPVKSHSLAPLHKTSGHSIPGHYIVILRQGAAIPRSLASRLGVTPDIVYSHAIHGFAATLTPAQLEAVRKAPDVESVEEDAVFKASQDAPRARGPSAQWPREITDAWGLDRIDQKKLPLDGQFDVAGTGEGVTAFIVDTGIDYSHAEFGGRAKPGVDLVDASGDGRDCPGGTGHGTHVAGIVGGTQHGVARKASLVSVRVLDCNGDAPTSRFVGGLDWVASNVPQAPAVLNASVNGPQSPATNSSVSAVATKGILPVVAAGNDNADACLNSPASAKGALPVEATNRLDQLSAFSNWGSCVKLAAPGEDIPSALNGGGTVTKSGTSQASPHVAGVAALYLQRNPSASPSAVATWLEDRSTKNVLTGLRGAGTPNKLLYTDGL